MPKSGKELVSLFKKAGYNIDKGGGKGIHWKLKRKGHPTVIIPNHKELAKGTERSILNILKKVKN